MDIANKETVKYQEDQKEAFSAEIEGEWTVPSYEAEWQERALEWVTSAARAAIIKYYKWGYFNNTNLFSHHSGNWKVLDQGSSRIHFLVRALFLAYTCCSVLTWPFLESMQREREGGKGEIEREREREKDLLGYQSADSNLGTLFNLNYLFIGPISKYSHIVG